MTSLSEIPQTAQLDLLIHQVDQGTAAIEELHSALVDLDQISTIAQQQREETEAQDATKEPKRYIVEHAKFPRLPQYLQKKRAVNWMGTHQTDPT